MSSKPITPPALRRAAILGLSLALLLALLASIEGGGGPSSVGAQEPCTIKGLPIDCDDPGIVAAHVPYCAYEHYHGSLNGEADPNPGFCGHGPVLRPDDTLLSFTSGDAWADGIGPGAWQGSGPTPVVLSNPSGEPFRFGDDPSGPPTIEPRYGLIEGVGAGLLNDIGAYGPAGSPIRNCDNGDTSLAVPGDDGLLVLCGGEPLREDVPYVVVIAHLGDAPPPAGQFSQHYSFQTAFGDGPTWTPLPQYPGDTWQGGSFFPTVTQDGSGFFQFSAQAVGDDGQLMETPTDSVIVIGGNQIGLFAPVQEYPGLDESTLGDFGYGFAVHIHDGSMGACATCESIVSAFPAVPRDGLFQAPADTWPIIAPGGNASTDATSTPAPISGAATTGSGPSTTTDGDASIVEGDDGGFPLGVSLIGMAVAAGLAGLYWQRQRFFGGPAVAIDAGPSIMTQIEGGTGVQTPPAANAETRSGPPPSTLVGDVEIDEDLIAGVATYFKEQDATTTTDVTNRERADWETSLIREQEAQERLQGEFGRLLHQVNAAWADYRAAVDRYRSKFTLMMSGSTEMQGLLATWAETRGIAQKQDLAFAVVTLLWTGGQLAVKGVKWATSGGRAATQGGDAASDAARTGQAAATYSSQTPSTFAMMDMLLAKRAAGMQRIATEAGIDLAQHMARYVDDAEEGYRALIEIGMKARGWVTLTADAEYAVSRLLVNGRAALAGRGAMAADDVALLQRWAQTPGFWEKLGKSAAIMDEVGWIGSHADVHQFAALLYTADDINFLRRVAESGGDLTKLGELLGPARATALASLDGTLAKVVANAPTFAAPGAAATLAQNAMNADPLTKLGGVSSFTDQFGITSKFGDLDAEVDAGNVGGTIAEAGALFGSELWDLVSSPFETYQEYKFTFEAQGVYSEFIQNHADELTGMSTDLDEAVRALERLQQALRSSGVGSSGAGSSGAGGAAGGGNGPLHRRKQELRDVLEGMRRQQNVGDQEWQDEFGDQFDERKQHIEDKLAYIEGMESQLASIGERLPQMIDWLNSIRRPGGQMRSFTSFIDPEIAVRLVSVQTFLDASLGAAYRNPAGTAGTSSAPEPPSTPAGPTIDLDTLFDEGGVSLEPPTDAEQAEIDRKWNEEMERLNSQWDEYDSLPQDYELDVDLNFDNLDAPSGE